MAWELRDNTGTLYKNTKKQKDTHPNATGTAMIGGKIYYVSAWTKQGQNGVFQSLAFREKDEQDGEGQRSSNNSRRPPPDYGDESDDIPF